MSCIVQGTLVRVTIESSMMDLSAQSPLKSLFPACRSFDVKLILHTCNGRWIPHKFLETYACTIHDARQKMSVIYSAISALSTSVSSVNFSVEYALAHFARDWVANYPRNCAVYLRLRSRQLWKVPTRINLGQKHTQFLS